MIFFILPFAVQAEVDDFTVKELNRGYWQINTTPPTKEQLLLLYDVTNSEELIVDDSQVNYEQLGQYDVVFSQGNSKQIIAKMTIQEETPIEFTQEQLLQVELDDWTSVTDEAVRKMINRESFSGYIFELIGHGIDPTTIGTYPISVTVTDIFGRKTNAELSVDVVDMQAPQIQIVHENVHYDKDEVVTTDQLMKDAQITIKDNVSSMNQILVEWYLSDMTTKVVGEYKVGIQATDANQNVSAITYLTVTVGEPTALKKKIQYEVNERPSLEQMKKDLGSHNIATVQMNQVDFSRIAVYQMPIKMKNGQESIIEVSIVDTQAPTLIVNATTLEYPQKQKLTEQQLIDDLQLQISDNYDRELEVQFSKTMEQLETAGQHQVTVSVIDSSGNEASLAITIQIGQEENGVPLLNNNQSNDSDMTWEYASSSEDESEFQPKVFNPTSDEGMGKSELLQQGEAVAAKLNGNELKKDEYLQVIFFILFFIAMIVIGFSIATSIKKKRIVLREKPKTRRYTKG